MPRKKLAKKKIIRKRKNPQDFRIRDIVTRFDRIGRAYRNSRSIDGDLAYAIAEGFIKIDQKKLFTIEDKVDAIRVLTHLERIVNKVKSDLQEEI